MKVLLLKELHERWMAARSSVSRPQACNYIKREALAKVFSCEFCEIFKNTFFTEHVWATASGMTATLSVAKTNILLKRKDG